MTRNFLKLTLFGIFLLLLFILSEAVFIWKNPTQITTYGFTLSKWFSQQGKTDKSLVSAIDTAYYFHFLNTNKTIDRADFQIETDNLSADFLADYKKYIDDLPYSHLMPSGFYDYSRFLYEVGLLAYRNSDTDLTFRVWNIAATIDPTLSYWQVEIANLYLSEGNQQAAIETLEKCTKEDYPKKHCEEFLQDIVKPNQPLDPGFLLVETEGFYKFNSFLFKLFPEKFNNESR